MKNNHTKDEQSEVRGVEEQLGFEDCMRLRDAGLKHTDLIYRVIKGKCPDENCRTGGLKTSCHTVFSPTIKELCDAYIILTQTLTHLQEQHEADKQKVVEDALEEVTNIKKQFESWKTLTQERHEREKRELVEDMLNINYGMKAGVNAHFRTGFNSAVATIFKELRNTANRHGLSTKE